MTLEEVAAMLGANGEDWATERLRRYAPAVGSLIKAPDDSFDRLAFKAAHDLQIWLRLEDRAYDEIGEECPDCIGDADRALDELLPLIAAYVRQPGRRGGPTPDDRRHICAETCASIWREFHPATTGPNSDTLLAACEAYWQACNQPPTAADLSGHLRNWKQFLASNSTKKYEVR